MMAFADDFGPFDGKVWLNSASEGPLPKCAVEALRESISWKINPAQLTHQKFAQVPKRLKDAVGRLLNVPGDEIILGNSATYGIHLLANGFPLRAGDEILLMRNDFPTDILPWLHLAERGVHVRQLPSQNHILTVAEVEQSFTPATRVICLPHVHTFSGHTLDLDGFSEFCFKNKIILLINASQSLGYMPLDAARLRGVAAIISAGFKWLCGPYGTGVCWVRPELRETLRNTQAFWVNRLTEQELASTGDLALRADTSAKTFDVFGTANFFNFVPLTASVEYLLSVGVPNINKTIQSLLDRLLKGLDQNRYCLISPSSRQQRSALLVFSHIDPARNPAIFRKLLDAGIYCALWKGNIRVAPHIFNTDEDIAKLLAVLHAVA